MKCTKCWLIYYSVFRLKFMVLPFSSLLYFDLNYYKILDWKLFYSSDFMKFLDSVRIFYSISPYSTGPSS